LEDSKTKRFIIEKSEDGEPVGLIWYYSMRPYKSCEIGIYLGVPRLCGKGYGSAAITTFLAFLFHSKGLHRVGLSVSARNERAIAAYEKCGFKCEGVTREFAWMHGEYVDLVEMGILRREFEGQD
jgi:RimJ/RimL family protein N-acetyltransferase